MSEYRQKYSLGSITSACCTLQYMNMLVSLWSTHNKLTCKWRHPVNSSILTNLFLLLRFILSGYMLQCFILKLHYCTMYDLHFSDCSHYRNTWFSILVHWCYVWKMCFYWKLVKTQSCWCLRLSPALLVYWNTHYDQRDSLSILLLFVKNETCNSNYCTINYYH